MDLITFLNQKAIDDTVKIVSFVGNNPPLLFLSIIKKKLKQFFPVIALEDSDDEANIKAPLEISFLGSKNCYWLSSEIVTQPKFVHYLESYQGPHLLAFFIQKPLAFSESQRITIEIPLEIPYSLFVTLFTWIYPEHSKNVELIKQIYKRYPVLKLDEAYMLMHYCVLIRTRPEIFLDEWIKTLISPEKSLFTLSSLFFAKKGTQLLELWKTIADDYSDQFWIAFWSEQLFRATGFMALHQEGNFIQAKKIAFRLPFSLIQKDWKVLKLSELKNAHNYLYTLDWNIKNGLSSNFEHFYIKFILNKFL